MFEHFNKSEEENMEFIIEWYSCTSKSWKRFITRADAESAEREARHLHRFKEETLDVRVKKEEIIFSLEKK